MQEIIYKINSENNREIKFKALSCESNIIGNIWIYGYFSMGHMMERAFITDFINQRTVVDQTTVCQFWKRINGHNYYENDIFSIPKSDGTKVYKWIKYIDERNGFCIANTYDIKNISWMDIWQNVRQDWIEERKHEIKYEGNIFDNPELLEN